MRRQLRSGKPPPDQRPVRRPALAGAGAGHRRAHPERGDRVRLLPGDPSPGAVPRVQCLRRARRPRRADASPDAHRDARGALQAGSGGPGDPRRHRTDEAGDRAGAGRRLARAHRARARRAGPCGLGAECRLEGDDPGGGRLPGCARRAGRAGLDTEGAGRPRAARQGVRRARQSLRRRHDGTARLLLGLPGDGALRHPADARHRLPLPAVLPDRGPRRPGGPARLAAGSSYQGGHRPGRRGQGDHPRDAAAAGRQEIEQAPRHHAQAR